MDTIDWRARPLATLGVALFFLGVVLLVGFAGGQDIR
jgi:hypothetical protein